MRNFRIYGLSAVAATALLMAGCGGGGGGGTRPDAPTPRTGTPTTGTTTSANAVDLMGQTVTAGEYMIAAGATMKVDGVRFECTGDTDCTVTVAEDGMSATSSAGMVMAALLEKMGNQAFMNLSVCAAEYDGGRRRDECFR